MKCTALFSALAVPFAVSLFSLPGAPAHAAPAPNSAASVARPPLTAWLQQVDRFDTSAMPAHPRLLLTPPEMERVRVAAQSPDGKAYWQAVRRYLDEERAKPVPAEPAGFKDNTWNIDDWRRIVNAGGDAQNHILAAAFGYVVSQDPADLDLAKRWTLGVAAWNPNGPTGIEGVDHDSHDVLHALALSYDWLYPHWTPAERAALQTCIAARGRALYKHLNPYRYDSWNNHAWFQTTALVDAGLALANDPSVEPAVAKEADTWWRYGSRLYLTEYLPLGGRDGDWHEGTHYISYTLIFVYQWADALRSATGINAYEVPWVKQVGHFRLMVNPPRSGGIKFNDNNFTGPDTWDRMTAYNAARQAHDPVLQWYARAMDVAPPSNPLPALYTLIYMDPGLPPRAPGADLPLGTWYRDSGWVVFRTDLSRSDDLQFGLKAGPHLAEKGGKGHDHPDQNGFLLNYGNEELAVDSGYYDYYGSPHHTNWTFTPQAHNTLLVDGQGQQIAPPVDSRVTSFVSRRDGLDFSESEAAPSYPDGLLKSWRRQVLFVRPDLFLIRDVVKPAKPVTLDWLLHGPNAFDLSGQAFTVTNKKAAMAGVIAAPKNLVLKQWGGFPADAQPERTKFAFPDQWHLTASTPRKVGDTVFVTALRPGPAGKVSVPAIHRSLGSGVEFVTLGEGADAARCAFTEGGALRPVLGWRTDARVVARRGADALVSQATTVRNGRSLFESSAPADVSGSLEGDGWRAASIHLMQPARVMLRLAGPSRAVSVDGKPQAIRPDGTITLDLPEGSHTVSAG